VLVVDEHEVVHTSLREALMGETWVERCLSAHTLEEAVICGVTQRPEVALVELEFSGDSGIELCRVLRAVSPAISMLLTSTRPRLPREIVLDTGAAGYVAKGIGLADIAKALRAVAVGMTVFPTASGEHEALSAREREVLALIAAGATNVEIAQRLYRSPHTVKQQASAAYRKLGARNRADAVRRAQRLGLIP
jgi:two-component system response regulator DesR